MTDKPDTPHAGETSLQKALRLKKAALEARSGPSRGKAFKPQAVAGMPSGASKPWMKK